jgi:chitin synthase
VIYSPHFFDVTSSFLYLDAAISNVDVLIGMDADTVFAPDCISELPLQAHRRRLRLCLHCQYWLVSMDRIPSPPNKPSRQSIRHTQSLLPPRLLPTPQDLRSHTRRSHSLRSFPAPLTTSSSRSVPQRVEDRNHVCLMLSARPKSRLRQALKARAYTDVPRSWSLSGDAGRVIPCSYTPVIIITNVSSLMISSKFSLTCPPSTRRR